MQRSMITCVVVASCIALALGACKRSDAPAVSNAPTASSDTRPSWNSGADVAAKTLPNRPDVCSFVSADEAAKLIGPLAGAPWRGYSTDDTSHTSNGRACVFPLAPREGVEPGSTLVIEFNPDGAFGFEVAAGMLGGIMTKQMGKDVADQVKVPGKERSDGWDYIGGIGGEIDGRIGHLGIKAERREARVNGDSIVKLMALIRDRVPDIPFAADEEKGSDEGNACTLLTRAEVESVLGPLAIPPYRSDDMTPLADPHGNGCSYYTGKHRVFSTRADWNTGKAMFRVIAGAGQNMTAKLGVAGASADTLDGTWDQAGADMAGRLMFLKGDRLFGLEYRTSTTDVAGAVKLARKAVTRLAK